MPVILTTQTAHLIYRALASALSSEGLFFGTSAKRREYENRRSFRHAGYASLGIAYKPHDTRACRATPAIRTPKTKCPKSATSYDKAQKVSYIFGSSKDPTP